MTIFTGICIYLAFSFLVGYLQEQQLATHLHREEMESMARDTLALQQDASGYWDHDD